jgi:hypothetical protein
MTATDGAIEPTSLGDSRQGHEHAQGDHEVVEESPKGRYQRVSPPLSLTIAAGGLSSTPPHALPYTRAIVDLFVLVSDHRTPPETPMNEH